MITDPVPRTSRRREEYQRSDGLLRLALPPDAVLRPVVHDLFAAVGDEAPVRVRRAAQAVADEVSAFHSVVSPDVRILGVRPHRVEGGTCTYELFGDYAPDTRRIRVWMRTAIRERVSSPRALLNTLLHEVAHHLDCTALALPETFHTRGFFHRIDGLYHHALGTPAAQRRPLRWIKTGTRWRIDWTRLRARP